MTITQVDMYIDGSEIHYEQSRIGRAVKTMELSATFLVSLPCEGSNPTMIRLRFFCNIYFFRVPRSWTGSVEMKTSMIFIRGNRCIERKIIFKIRLKECALALNFIRFIPASIG